METFICNVGELAPTDRTALERVVGQHLRESQQLVIQVVSVAIPASKPAASGLTLPEWCNVYEGLSDGEIAELESAIVRSHVTRDLP